MLFGPIETGRAEGAVLAHTIRLSGLILAKGTRLTAQAVAALRDEGHASVLAARLEIGDVGENEAAERIGRALVFKGGILRATRTGRSNLYADHPGLLLIDPAIIERLNMIDPAITIATIPARTRIARRDRVATIKVIPFAVHGPLVAEVEVIARSGSPFALHPFRPMRVALVTSQLASKTTSKAMEAVEAATRGRVEALGGVLVRSVRVDHQRNAIAMALASLHGEAALIVLAGAAASVDRSDIAPQAVEQAGGLISHLGMPAEPGNMLGVGQIGDASVVIAPSCARSPKMNGLDLVLERLFAGLRVDANEIARMGVGGLLTV